LAEEVRATDLGPGRVRHRADVPHHVRVGEPDLRDGLDDGKDERRHFISAHARGLAGARLPHRRILAPHASDLGTCVTKTTSTTGVVSHLTPPPPFRRGRCQVRRAAPHTPPPPPRLLPSPSSRASRATPQPPPPAHRGPSDPAPHGDHTPRSEAGGP